MQRLTGLNFKHLLLIVFAIALLTPSVALAKDTLIIGWDDWAPHQMEDSNGNLTGVNIELIKEICSRAGFKTKFRKIPWKRNLLEMKTGKCDIAMSASKTDERAQYAYFSDAYFKLEYNVVFVRKSDKEKYSSIKSLKDIIGTDFKLGTTLGSVYSDEHEQLLKNEQFTKNVQEVSGEEMNIKKLMKNRIDGFIADELGGASLIKKLGFESDISVLFPLYGEEEASAYLMFSKKSMTQADVDKMNKALNAMKSDGSYNKILSKYQLK